MRRLACQSPFDALGASRFVSKVPRSSDALRSGGDRSQDASDKVASSLSTFRTEHFVSRGLLGHGLLPMRKGQAHGMVSCVLVLVECRPPTACVQRQINHSIGPSVFYVLEVSSGVQILLGPLGCLGPDFQS